MQTFIDVIVSLSGIILHAAFVRGEQTLVQPVQTFVRGEQTLVQPVQTLVRGEKTFVQPVQTFMKGCINICTG